MNIETFGKYVSYLRTDRDFSLREFAEMIDLSPYYLCSIENGRRTNPNIKTLGKMYLALNLRKEEMEKLLDLYAKANGQASADIIDWELVSTSLWTRTASLILIISQKALKKL